MGRGQLVWGCRGGDALKAVECREHGGLTWFESWHDGEEGPAGGFVGRRWVSAGDSEVADVADGAVDEFIIGRADPCHDIVFVASQSAHEESAVGVEEEFEEEVCLDPADGALDGLEGDRVTQVVEVEGDLTWASGDAEDVVQSALGAAASEFRELSGEVVAEDDWKACCRGDFGPCDGTGGAVEEAPPCGGTVGSCRGEQVAP